MNTLHIDSEMGWGGGQVELEVICRYLKTQGHGVRIICRPGSKLQEWASQEEFDCLTVSMRSTLDIHSVLQIRSIIADFRPDIVHLHTSKAHVLGGAAARLAGSKVVIATRRMQYPVKMLWPNTSAYGKWTNAVIAVSESVRQALIDSGVNSEKIKLIESGADVETFANASPDPNLRSSLGINNDVPIIATAAKLVEGKGIYYLLEAAALIKQAGLDVQIVIAGDGEQRVELESLAESLAVNAIFLGFYKDMSALIASIDVFAMPSLSEGLGIAAIEAMAAGKPVVASAVGGLNESIINGETGYLVPPRDPQALCDAICKLLQNEEQAIKYGTAGQARAAEKFSLSKMAQGNEALYFELLNGVV